ncbi:MAG: hypothetical protein E7616_09460 [Ruminococcaceae bacterium]|nr:hypothetical protein [Oscillospiraceae bacterium]
MRKIQLGAILLLLGMLFSMVSCVSDNNTPSPPEKEPTPSTNTTEDPTLNDPTVKDPTPHDPTPDIPLPETPFITLPSFPMAENRGDLILVNRDYHFDSDLVLSELLPVQSAVSDPELAEYLKVERPDMALTEITAYAFAQLSKGMQTALSCDKKIHVYSAFRDNAYQQSIIDDYLSRPNYGQSYVDNYVAPVGASEHHTGMAADINLIDENKTTYSFRNALVATEYAWILEHAHEYGLIRRYTDDKKEFTGYNEEVWHFRYVGVPHAEYMYQNNICFEEYHILLADTAYDAPLVITTSLGETYSVYTDDPSDGLQVPRHLAYTLSGSNSGSYIVTVNGSYSGAGVIDPSVDPLTVTLCTAWYLPARKADMPVYE